MLFSIIDETEIAALSAKGEFPTPWSRKLQKMVAKMTAEELAEFPDLTLIHEVHTLIFTASYQLSIPGLSLPEVISACGRRLRGIRLGLAISHDLLGSYPASLHKALQKAHEKIDGWRPWDPTSPLEVQLADTLILEWQAMYLLTMEEENEAVIQAAQLGYALNMWKNEAYRKKVMERLDEIGVVDFNPDDLHSRLVSLTSEFYLNHVEGAPRVDLGITLLGELIAFDEKDFGSAYCLANIRIRQGNPKAGYEIARRGMDVAVASGFQYNAARLGLCTVEAILAGAQGDPGLQKEEVKALLGAARRRLDSCRFWLPPSKYARYHESLRVHENKFLQNTPKGSKGNGQGGSSGSTAIQQPPIYKGYSLKDLDQLDGCLDQIEHFLRQCAHCDLTRIEDMQKCSGCRDAYYCSTKCQREDWPSHREACKQAQAERKASSSAGAKAK